MKPISRYNAYLHLQMLIQFGVACAAREYSLLFMIAICSRSERCKIYEIICGWWYFIMPWMSCCRISNHFFLSSVRLHFRYRVDRLNTFVFVARFAFAGEGKNCLHDFLYHSLLCSLHCRRYLHSVYDDTVRTAGRRQQQREIENKNQKSSFRQQRHFLLMKKRRKNERSKEQNSRFRRHVRIQPVDFRRCAKCQWPENL